MGCLDFQVPLKYITERVRRVSTDIEKELIFVVLSIPSIFFCPNVFKRMHMNDAYSYYVSQQRLSCFLLVKIPHREEETVKHCLNL